MDKLPLIREEVGNLVRFLVDSVDGEWMVRSAGPARMWHLEEALANQDHLAALAR